MESGHIELIYGPMFSGKSTELLRRIRRHTIAKRRCLVVKFKHDTRYSEQKMSTHDLQMMEAIPCVELEEIKELYQKYDVIGVDEGQFFPDIVETCDRMADDGKIVIVAALDGTFQRKPFGPILDLIPYAERVSKLTSVCAVCGRDGSYTQRIVGGDQLLVIGGEEMYRPVCRACFNQTDKSKSHLIQQQKKKEIEEISDRLQKEAKISTLSSSEEEFESPNSKEKNASFSSIESPEEENTISLFEN